MKLPQRSFPRVRASASITPPSQPFQLPPKVDLAVVQPVMWPELDGKLRRDGISIPAPDLRSEKLAWVSMSTRQCWTRSGLFVLRTGPLSRDLPIECQRSFGRSPWFVAITITAIHQGESQVDLASHLCQQPDSWMKYSRGYGDTLSPRGKGVVDVPKRDHLTSI
ncbi:hypothetical protein BR93DRAFT_300162 [Coniochaeta sp. PMI_546]|nr:hypothetical protein BR93DRAFT_300162 [Coniochaeta sp. PMI_546]